MVFIIINTCLSLRYWFSIIKLVVLKQYICVMSVLDIILSVLLLFGLVRGFMKGLFVEVASLVALIAGVYGAIHFSYYAANVLEDKVSWDEKYINIVAFAITFVVIILIISLAGKALTKLADFAALGILNKILGGAFGALKIGLILSVVLMVFSRMNKNIPFVGDDALKNSILYEPIQSIAPLLFPNIIKAEDESDDSNTKTNE